MAKRDYYDVLGVNKNSSPEVYENDAASNPGKEMSNIHILRCPRSTNFRSRWWPYQ